MAPRLFFPYCAKKKESWRTKRHAGVDVSCNVVRVYGVLRCPRVGEVLFWILVWCTDIPLCFILGSAFWFRRQIAEAPARKAVRLREEEASQTRKAR